jgi:hypothetical protein
MTEKSDKPAPTRRSVLKLAGLGAVAGATGLAGAPGSAEAVEERQGGGYRETPHVLKVYETARF